ncbi:MAG: TonB-dependent siderophore receptor [Azospirillaceae bacterium]|nr:TonB-dependent siderophore receptor [Azospirillaceae bacterium]
MSRTALLLLATTALAPLSVATPALAQTGQQAQTAPGARHFDIPAQALATAVNAFGRQAGMQVTAEADVVADVQVPALSGDYQPADALNRLLAGTGVTWRQAGGTFVLMRAPQASGGVLQLGAVRVQGDSGTAPRGGNLRGPSGDPVARRLNPQTTIGSKDAVNQREIPQSVTVITQDEIQAQNMVTVDDVIRSTPGMLVTTVNPNDTTYVARGFPITAFQIDGVPTAIPAGGAGVAADNLAMYDRVEILRGPAGLFNGFGGDGGVINLVRKQAPDTLQASAVLSGGTYDTLRGQLDVGSPLNEAGTLRFRAVGSEQYQDLMQDTTWQRDRQAYGTLEADLTPTLTARAGISYSDTNGRLMYGIPYTQDDTFASISRSAYLGADWNHFHNDRLGEFLELSQQFDSGWDIKASYEHHRLNTRYLDGIADLIYDAATSTGEMYDYKYNQTDNQHAVDVYASGPFTLFGRVHKITVGANYLHDYTQGDGFLYNTATGYDAYGSVYNINVYDNSLYAPVSGFNGGDQYQNATTTEQVGTYGNVRLSITDALTLVGGGRLTWWNSRNVVPDDAHLNAYGASNTDDHLGPKFSPIAGLIYDLDQTYTLYGSYTSIYKPQTGAYTVSGGLLRPIEGEQYEIGVKGEHFGGRLTTSIALFHTEETNNAVQDPTNQAFVLPSGKVRSQGVELQAHGQILPGWTMLVGYTYDDAERAADNSDNNFAVGLTPHHLFKLSTDYTLPGDLSAWSVGGTLHAESNSTWSCCSGATLLHKPGYATTDLRVSYAFTPKVSLSASVTNLFDRYYIDTAGGAENTLGDPRKVLFTLRAAY